jgi:hypothetical protein
MYYASYSNKEVELYGEAEVITSDMYGTLTFSSSELVRDKREFEITRLECVKLSAGLLQCFSTLDVADILRTVTDPTFQGEGGAHVCPDTQITLKDLVLYVSGLRNGNVRVEVDDKYAKDEFEFELNIDRVADVLRFALGLK